MDDESMIDALAEEAGNLDAAPAVINPARMRDMRKAELIIQKMAEENHTKIKCIYNEPFKTMGSIEMEMKELNITDMESFKCAVLLADNLDIYPLLNGNIRVSFGFNGIVIPVMEEDL